MLTPLTTMPDTEPAVVADWGLDGLPQLGRQLRGIEDRLHEILDMQEASDRRQTGQGGKPSMIDRLDHSI